MEAQVSSTSQSQQSGKTPLFIAGIVILVLMIGGVSWWLLKDDGTSSPELMQGLADATEKSSIGDYEGALQDLTAAEAQAKTSAEKVRLYSELAAAATSAGKLDEALAYYAKKHAAGPSTKGEDGYIIGTIYERKEDPGKALEQYKLYAEYLDTQPDNEMLAAQKDSLTETIKALEAGQ